MVKRSVSGDPGSPPRLPLPGQVSIKSYPAQSRFRAFSWLEPPEQVRGGLTFCGLGEFHANPHNTLFINYLNPTLLLAIETMEVRKIEK